MFIKYTNYSNRRLQAVSSSSTVLLLLLATFELPKTTKSFFIDKKQSPGLHEWNYADQSRWSQLHRDCAGRAQSPIDIQHKNVITSQHLKLHFYNYNQPLKFKLSNAHHTIKMNPTGTPAYDQEEAERAAASSGSSGGFNTSSIHDIITADEYVEFAPTNNQQQSQQLPGDVGARLLATSSSLNSQHDKDQHVSSLLATESRQEVQRNLNRSRPNGNQVAASGRGRQLGTLNNGGQQQQQQHATRSHTDAAYGGAPTIKLDWLDDGNNEYKLRDIHFHWGERRDNGSEHAIDGRRAAMEMHLVHLKHGLDKSKIGFTSDSVAVIAILIESHRKSNADFNPIVNELERINSTETKQTIDYKSIYDLLPSNLGAFYTYSGSLTTPPCYQVVNWIVMAERLNMNAKQIEMFRNLYAPPIVVEEEQNNDDHDNDDDDHEEHQQHRQNLKQHSNSFEKFNERRFDSIDSTISTLKTPTTTTNNEMSEIEAREAVLIMPNVRAIQTLNNRTILASFTKYGSRLTTALNNAGNSGSLKSFRWANVFSALLPTLIVGGCVCSTLALSKPQLLARLD